MQQLISLEEEIRRVIGKSGCEFKLLTPSVVVVGSQSAGKASLIETIVGIDFIPNTSVSCPIEIELVHGSGGISFEFEHKKGERFQDISLIKSIILQEIQRINVQSTQILSTPFKLRIHWENLPNMLIVLIPGFSPHQFLNPDNATLVNTRNLSLNNVIIGYLSNDPVVISVCKATSNLKDTQIDRILQGTNRRDVRVIKVLTGIDEVDQNIDSASNSQILNNPSSYGFIPLLLKQPQTSHQKHLQMQQQYFSSHRIYNKHKSLSGFPHFYRTLQNNILRHYKNTIPQLRQTIISQFQQSKEEYSEYGEYDTVDNPNTQQLLLLSIISNFSKRYTDLIQGKSCDTEQLQGGARIEYIFNTIFNQPIMAMDPFEYLSNDDIRTAVNNANGFKKSLFINQMAFENLVKQQIGRLLLPSIECSRIIFQELKVFITRIVTKELLRWRVLHKRIKEVVNEALELCLTKTEEMIEAIIEVEMGYINTNHPDFIKQVDRNTKSTHSSNNSQEQLEVTNIKGRNRPKEPNSKGEVEQINHKLQRSSVKEFEMQKEQTLSIHSVRQSKPYFTTLPRLHLPLVPPTVTVSPHVRAREITQINLIKKFILCYFNVVKKNITDSIPKTIVTFLVNRSRQMCEKSLINQLYKTDKLGVLFAENEGITRKREELKCSIKVLKECLHELNKINDKIV